MIMFSHVIFYVKDISQSLSFFSDAFALSVKFLHESGQYAELNTGTTSIAFVSEELGDSNLPNGYTRMSAKQLPQACEIAFTVDDVQAVYENALRAGALSVTQPTMKPWGQLVAYVRDPNGILIELGSPIA